MKSKELKKIFASLGVAGLISAGGINVPGAHAAGSGCGGTKPSASNTDEVKHAAGSGCSGMKDSAGSVVEEQGQEMVDEATDQAAEAAKNATDAAADSTKKKVNTAIEGC